MIRINPHAAVTAALLLGLGAAGCSQDKPAPRTAATPPALLTTGPLVPAAGPAARQDTISPTSGSIHIDDKIRLACGDIPIAHFAFDSAAIGPEAQGALDALARCFVTGALKGKPVRLTGFADSRGEVEYNLGLGQKRAGSVGDYLFTKGLDKHRIQSLSKGSFEATGTDEAGWARDRKVEITLPG